MQRRKKTARYLANFAIRGLLFAKRSSSITRILYATHVLSEDILYREVNGATVSSTRARIFRKRATRALRYRTQLRTRGERTNEPTIRRFFCMHFSVWLRIPSTNNLSAFLFQLKSDDCNFSAKVDSRTLSIVTIASGILICSHVSYFGLEMRKLQGYIRE